VTRVFIGLENINPDNLAAANKRQNKITEYRKMLLAWKAHGIITIAGYILGLPADTPESIRRDIKIIQKELPLDILEFFHLTPLPGSEDHRRLWKAGIAMDPDLNKYDLEHACAAHAKMSKEEREAIYLEAWSLYYTTEHAATLLRRGAATGVPLGSLVKLLVRFAIAAHVEKVHPLQDGILRMKHPAERRPGLPRVSAWAFWPRFIWETLRKQTIAIGVLIKLIRVMRAIRRDPEAANYTDQALTPVHDDDGQLDLLTKTSGAQAAVAHIRHVDDIIRVAGSA
jgi:hypothetical protein